MPTLPLNLLRRAGGLRSLLIIAAAALLHAPATQASDAVIVELYRDCKLADTTVIIEEGVLAPEQNAEVKARAAVAAASDPDAALPRIARILKEYGVDEVDVARQGFEGCEPRSSGKYVEAVGTYCGPTLARAEVLVDRQSMITRSDPDMTFEAFLRAAVLELRGQGIYDRPVVSIENAPDCEEDTS